MLIDYWSWVCLYSYVDAGLIPIQVQSISRIFESSMTLTLAHHPGPVVFVDDDETFLSAIDSICDSNLDIKTFGVPNEFLSYMSRMGEKAKGMNSFQRGAIDRFKRGGSVAMEAIRFWNTFPDRYELPMVVVIDYHMPGLNGLETLTRLPEWTGKNILLTGVADEAIVCRAFNERRIDYYIPKQNSKLLIQINTAIAQMLKKQISAAIGDWNVWAMSLCPEQNLILQSKDVAGKVDGIIGDSCEYFAMGAPFGILMLGFDGQVKWLQLETVSSLDEAADLALSQGAAMDVVQSIRAGRELSDARIRSALRLNGTPAISSLALCIQLPEISEVLFGAVFDLEVPGAPSKDLCYRAWQTRIRSTTA